MFVHPSSAARWSPATLNAFTQRNLCLATVLALAGLAVDATAATAAIDDAVELDAVEVVGTRQTLGLDETSSNGALGSRSLLDTPFSITRVGQDDIARRQATDLGQIFINDPSVLRTEASATTNWWGLQIRGLGVRSHYVDGVPVQMNWGGEFPVETVESVQALKGLGGFMYGFATPGGVISYQTKKPTEAPLLATTLGYRNGGAVSAHVDAGGRINGPGSLGYRINAASENGDAYNGAGIARSLTSVALELPIGDALSWHFNGFHEHSRLAAEPFQFYMDQLEGERLPDPTYDYGNVSVRNSYYKTDTLHGTTGLTWQINPDWDVALNIGHSRRKHYSNKMFANLLNDAGDYAGTAYNFPGLFQHTVYQLLVQGQQTTGPIRHQLVFGGATQRNQSQYGTFYWSNDFNGNIYQPQPFLVTREIDFTLNGPKNRDRQHALFASDTLHFGEHWQAILGVRGTTYDQLDADGSIGYETRATTPTAALIFKPADNIAIYGSHVESLEAGQTVDPPYANAGEVLGATISKQRELGAKYDAERFGFTAAAFQVDRAATIDRVLDNGQRHLIQDGLIVYRGVEAIARRWFGDRLQLGLGATWLDASIEEVSPENAALRGNRPTGASKLQALVNAEYLLSNVPGLSVHGNLRYFGSAWATDDNRLLIPSHAVANAGVQYRTTIGDCPVVLTGNINNLFNRGYWRLDALGEERNASLSMRMDW